MKLKFLRELPVNGLRFRLLSSIMIAVSLLLGAQNLLIQRFQESIVHSKFIEKGETLTRLLANSSRVGVFAEDESMLHGPALAVMGESDVVEIKIFNSEWKILKRISHEKVGKRCECLSEEKQIEVFKNTKFSKNIVMQTCKFCMSFWMPVVVSGDSHDAVDDISLPPHHDRKEEILGYVYIRISPDQFNQALGKFKRYGFAATLFFLISLLTLIYYLVLKATRPLSDLVKKIKASGFTESSGGEIEFIADSYGALAKTISQAFDNAGALKNSLERKVEAKEEALDAARMKVLEDRQNIEFMSKNLNTAFNELKNAQAQLVQAEKMAAMGLLVAGVAHEINNTINFVSGALPPLARNLAQIKNLLSRYDAIPFDESEENLNRYLDELSAFKKSVQYEKIMGTVDILMQNIHTGVSQTTKIVSDLRDFSRSPDRRREPADINDAMDKTLALLAYSMKNKITVAKEYYSDVLPINCVKGEISQVILNLLLNAVQAISDKGQISVKTWKKSNFAHFSIKDDGVGISAENLDKIFDPFFTTKPVGSGTGLGLGIVYGIINNHGGKIIVSSKEGKGSEFEVMIPLA